MLIGGPSIFASYHRQHHATADGPDDVQSPRRGWWYAHLRWFIDYEPDDRVRAQFRRDPIVRFYDQHALAFGLGGLVLAGVLGGVVGGTWRSAFTGLMWGGVVRMFAVHHALYFVSWAQHRFGTREFETHDDSRNSWWVGLLVLGEGLHNNHHAMPAAANQNAHRWQLDPQAWIIAGLERLGLAHDIRWATPAQWAKRPRAVKPAPERVIPRPPGERIGAAFVVALPIATFLVAAMCGWLADVTSLDIALFVALYVTSMLGLTLGYHRLLSHEAFVAHPILKATLLAFAGMAVQGSPSSFAATHRLHHARADRPGNPHSPGVGFWHAHFLWFLAPTRVDVTASRERIRRNRITRLFDSTQLVWALLGLALPFAVGWLATGELHGAARALLWGGILRLGVTQQLVWAFASLHHVFGSRAFATLDNARNNFWLNVLQLGDGWHNNHHAIPWAANFDERWWQIDFGGLVLRACTWCGLASEARWVSREEWEQRRIRLAKVQAVRGTRVVVEPDVPPSGPEVAERPSQQLLAS